MSFASPQQSQFRFDNESVASLGESAARVNIAHHFAVEFLCLFLVLWDAVGLLQHLPKHVCSSLVVRHAESGHPRTLGNRKLVLVTGQ